MMYAPVTAFYASLMALCYLYLTGLVINRRRKAQIGIGDGGNAELLRYTRVHANFSEYVPISLILLCLLELNSELQWPLHVAASALLFGRILHAYGLASNSGVSWQRFSGTLLTLGALLFMAVANLTIIYWVRLM